MPKFSVNISYYADPFLESVSLESVSLRSIILMSLSSLFIGVSLWSDFSLLSLSLSLSAWSFVLLSKTLPLNELSALLSDQKSSS